MSHTPGPWKVSKTGNYVIDKNDTVICDCVPGRMKSKEDALLIAAAPELLEALRELVLEFLPPLEQDERTYPMLSRDDAYRLLILRDAQRAVARAEGKEEP